MKKRAIIVQTLFHPMFFVVKFKTFLRKEYDGLKAFVEDKPL